MFKEKISPQDFETKERFWDSPFQNSEKEIVARNVVLISKKNNNQWFAFTWEEYCERCYHTPTWEEKSILDWFVSQGLMTCEDGAFEITDEFIFTLQNFLKDTVQV